MGKKMKRLCIYLTVFAMVLSMSAPVQAASAKSNALKAYNKLLTQKTVKWGNGGRKIPLKDCEFSLAYVDNDSVPELFISALTSHSEGSAIMYTFKNGKLRFVNNLFMDYGKFSYYKKKGIYIDNYFHLGVNVSTYRKLSNYKGIIKLSIYKEYVDVDHDGKLSTKYCINTNEKYKFISKPKFNNELKKLVGNQKKSSLVWRKNTKANRTKYIK